MNLWNRPHFPLSSVPFEHVVVDDFLPASVYDELAASFPECAAASGPTGFTIHPGDVEFDRVMAQNDTWRSLFQACDGQAFVDFTLGQFGDVFKRECVADLSQARHVVYRESRADKERAQMLNVEHAIDELWVRFDLMQGKTGYTRAPHVDHRRRAVTMLIYFNDADAIGMDGGDLLLHGQGDACVAVRPRANRMVMFPCHNRSWHSVSPITRQNHSRNFAQVTVSSSVDLWQPIKPSMSARIRSTGRRLVDLATRRFR